MDLYTQQRELLAQAQQNVTALIAELQRRKDALKKTEAINETA
jgi:prefoldin subunit 5